MNLTPDQWNDAFPGHIVLVAYRGSIAHNMYMPSDDPNSIDDKDIMGVVLNPLDHYFGLNNFQTLERQFDACDIVTYELRKFVRLLLKANPNVLSMLWLNREHYVERSTIANQLIVQRDMFLSKRVYHAFTGYAHSQLKRMTHHAFRGYMGEKRRALVERFGYDVKNAAHLIRLLRMGIEILNDHELHVFRKDAPQLLEIKRGMWKLDQVKSEADRLFKRAETAYDRCTLPARPDEKRISDILTELITTLHPELIEQTQWANPK